jgi:K+-transporting ATPase ATPase A chain
MTMQSTILLVVFLAVLLMLAYPLGILLTRVGDGSTVPGLGWLGKIEKMLYRLAGIAGKGGAAPEGQNWKAYAVALLLFNGIGALAVYALQRVQFYLPLNPQGMANISPDSAFGRAAAGRCHLHPAERGRRRPAAEGCQGANRSLKR